MKPPPPTPPRLAQRLLHWLCAPHRLDELEDDLDELFQQRVASVGLRRARGRYWRDVLSLLRPSLMKREKPEYPQPTNTDMLRNYLTIAWRNLIKNKGYSFINITGLASGMAVAMLIGLWVWDELSFNKTHKNYDRIAQVWQFVTFDVEKSSYDVLPIPLAAELRTKYPDFARVSLSKPDADVILAVGDKRIVKTGRYAEPDFLRMLEPTMLSGTYDGLTDVNSILLSESVSQALFGAENPLNKLVKFNNKFAVRVTGVYKDFPNNSTFNEAFFLAPWSLFLAINDGARASQTNWDENSYQLFAQLNPGVSPEQVSAKIRDIRMKRENPPPYKPEFFLHPMRKWHLYGDFKNGVNTGGLITFVWLFSFIGLFVLLLACINFMNLSTARSEKRAKEVGIRKAIGSVRGQLIGQFLTESILVTALAFGVALLLVQLSLPLFNDVADKRVSIPWLNPWFWLAGLGFSVVTGLLAASYPALYLSSFQAVKVLKGTFRAGRLAAVPRKVLVVFQFAVSVTLIIGTIVVFRQIEFVKDRPVGYTHSGLIDVPMKDPQLYGHYAAMKADFLATGVVEQMSESMGTITDDYGGVTDVWWPGKAPDMHPLLMSNRITHDYGKTIGWRLVAGRDFSTSFATDSSAMILNESALKLMGLKTPIGEVVKWNGKSYQVIGVVADMIKGDPFRPVSPSFFAIDYKGVNTINIRLSPKVATSDALAKIEQVFSQYSPNALFEYKFADSEYAKKFALEVRIGKLASVFAVLAIFISCLGLFGLASFVAEQRTKEIGVRKVLGASVVSLWGLLSRDFVLLVGIGFLIAAPLAYYILRNWLQNYEYRTDLSAWVFAGTGVGALLITLLTVSFQAIKAALVNPVKSLRSE